MLSRLTPLRSLVALAVLAAGCAAGDDIDNPSGNGPGSGGGGPGPSGSGGGDGGSTGAETTASGSTSSSGVGTPTSSASTGTGQGGDGGAPAGPGGSGPGGGEGGEGPSVGGGGQGGDGGSPPLPECGDGERNGTEACEGADLDGEDCESIGQGFIGGDLACNDACEFDTSGCTSPPDCGNGTIEGAEECDGAQLGGATCQTEGFDTGTIACTGGCALDVSDCSTCGNNTIEADEVCDGSALGGATCQNLGHDGGTLTCNGACSALVQTACTDCGDGQVEAPEECDGNNFAGATCATEGNFNGGTLLCGATTCNISTANCYRCGDGQVTAAEVCDGGNLDGQTCASVGFDGGTLSCGGTCVSFNTSQCFDSQCNDGLDNDGDGFTDFGNDLGCTGAIDASENQYASQCNGNGNPIFDTGYPQFSVSFYQPFDTTGFPDVSDAPCQSSTGPEIWFVYRNEQFQPDIYLYTQDTTNPGEMTDTVITVYRGSCTSGNVTCDDDAGVGSHAQVILTNVAANELLFVKVEGWSSQVGYGELVFDLFFNEI